MYDTKATPRLRGRRFPLEPLEALLGRPNTKQLARLLGTHAKQCYRWRDYGLTEEQADRLACRVGLHPCLVWSAAWWLDSDEDRYWLTEAGAAAVAS